MNSKILIGSTLAAMLVGSVAGGTVSAQTSTTPQATATAGTTNPGTTSPTTPSNPGATPGGKGGTQGGGPGGPGGFRGHGGPGGPGGPGGFGGRRGLWDGGNATSATESISDTTSLITLAKSDLAYANGKMDTTNVQKWLNEADSLLKSAQTADSSSQYGQTAAYANAARQLAAIAEQTMADKLGAASLPSASQRPRWGGPGRGASPGDTTATVTQAQASRQLAGVYNQLTTVAAQVKSASNASEATPYLTDAENAYKAAYTAYQSADYSGAVSSARLAQQLTGVAASVAQVSIAPANSDTPVTVPAPNF